MMESTKRILPIALVAALLGGSVGALVVRTPSTSAEAANSSSTLTPVLPATDLANSQTLESDQAAFRDGFEEGFLAAQQNGAVANNASLRTRSRYTGSSRSNSSYSHYRSDQPQPRKRSFWQKHRDKLTVAMGAGGGALVGGLIGGKKGALIGGLAGAGGSALYTYKLRNRNRQY